MTDSPKVVYIVYLVKNSKETLENIYSSHERAYSSCELDNDTLTGRATGPTRLLILGGKRSDYSRYCMPESYYVIEKTQVM